MLNFAVFTRLNSLLNEMSKLTAQLRASVGCFTESSLQYLTTLQDFADEHRLYISADVASSLQKLIVYSGAVKPTDKSSITRRNMKKERDAYAVMCLDDLRKSMQSFLAKDRKTYEECEDIWRQIISRLLAKQNILYAIPSDQVAETAISIATQDAELLPYFAHVSGLIGVFNSRMVLETILPQLNL